MAVATILLLLCLAVWIDWRPLGSRIAFPLYFLIPLCALAWFAGWLPALVATIASCILSVVGVSLAAFPGEIPLVSVLGRLVTFGLTLPCARASAVGRLMLTYFLLGDQLRARTVPIRIGLRPASEAGRGPDLAVRLSGGKSRHNDLLIRPGPSFGTGAHPTTQMCLRLMEDLVEPGQVVFDLGSGSGILSIAAAKLGASAVVAADTDPRAEQATRANIESNQVEDTVQFRRGSWPVFLEPMGQSSGPGRAPASGLSAGEVPKADLLVANILTSVHVEVLREGLARCVRPGGKLILSGIRFDGWSQIREAIEAAGLAVVEKRQMDVWLAVVAERPAEPPLADPLGRDDGAVSTGQS
ncbi:MAG: methyltransferase [Chloroflexi bacterium]|nr:methyltransferase [Chloroflexota bacterium]